MKKLLIASYVFVEFLLRPFPRHVAHLLPAVGEPALPPEFVKLAPRHAQIAYCFRLVVPLLLAGGEHLKALQEPLVLFFCRRAPSAVYAVYQLYEQRPYHLQRVYHTRRFISHNKDTKIIAHVQSKGIK